MSLRLLPIFFAGVALVLSFGAVSPMVRAAEPMTAVVLGGGPTAESNGAQIEGHTKFVAKLLPEGTRRFLYFSDGKAESRTVAHGDLSPVGEARRAMEALLPLAGLSFPASLRKAQLGFPVDGSSTRGALRRTFASLAARSGSHIAEPLLLYFAGHGSTRGEEPNTESTYELWKSDAFTVRDMAAQLARLPARVPVILVMAQCYSGGFGDLLFRDGLEKNGLAGNNLAGFFSARRDRTASGCGWEIGEADYQDFSSHFFAALSGNDQFGRPTPGGDFDGDGKVTLHEAFCYTLLHDESADTPVCTSQVLLRHLAPLSNRQVCETPYTEALAVATPAQRAVLEALSQRLGLEGETRALLAYDRLSFRDPIAASPVVAASTKAADSLNQLREKVLADFFARWPGLRWEGQSDFGPAVSSAVEYLAGQQTLRQELLLAKKEAESAEEKMETEEAFLMRFSDLFQSLVLTREVNERGSKEAKLQLARLLEAEQQTLPLRATPSSR